MLLAVTAGKAAPGVTTTVWALTLAWPRPVLAVDADPTGGDMLAGLLAGRADAERGLLSWSSAARRAAAIDATWLLGEHAVAVPEAADGWLLPGVQGPGQGGILRSGGWDRLARAVERAAATIGRDVVVDTGRLGDDACWPVLAAADRVLLAARPTLRSVHAARQAANMLRDRLGDLDKVGLLVIAAGRYSGEEVAGALALPLAGALPEDRDAAAALCDGVAAGLRGLRRSRLLRAARTLADAVATTAGDPIADDETVDVVGGRG